MPESTQHRLANVRPPRVHITYDVEVGDAIEKKELPMVVGILSDLVGQPAESPPRLKDRKFIQIDGENFDAVLTSLKPRLKYQVTDHLHDGGGQLGVELNFTGIADFRPEAIVQQIEPLRELLAARERLVDLLAKLDGNEDLHEVLRELIRDERRLTGVRDAVAALKAPTEQNG